ncbi:cell wall-binding repeat-containing protein [Faecalimicrobium sp. JNUCC 81]
MGGKEVISSKAENQLKEMNKELRIERIAGKDRFDTSYKIANRVNEIQKRVDKVFFVN